jgi:hypothetical protein
VDGFLPRLEFLRVHITLSIVSETPANGNIGVGILQSLEILTANPPRLVVVNSINGFFKKRLCRVVYVVADNAPELSGEHRAVSYGAPTAESVHEHSGWWEKRDYPPRNLVFRALIRDSESIIRHKKSSLVDKFSGVRKDCNLFLRAPMCRNSFFMCKISQFRKLRKLKKFFEFSDIAHLGVKCAIFSHSFCCILGN